MCTSKEYKMAALQAGRWCFCGDSGHDIYGTADNCDRPCSGNNQETCGGAYANQVYLLPSACKFMNHKGQINFDEWQAKLVPPASWDLNSDLDIISWKLEKL